MYGTFKEETSEVLRLENSLVWCWNLDSSEGNQKYFDFKCGAGKGWGRSLKTTVWEMKCYIEARTGISYIQQNKGRATGLVTSYVWTAFKTRYWRKYRMKWREDEEEEVRGYWMTLTKWQDIGNWNRKHQIAFCGELALKEATDAQFKSVIVPSAWRNSRKASNSNQGMRFTGAIRERDLPGRQRQCRQMGLRET